MMLKHPAGIIMRLFNMEEFDEPVYGGGIKKKQRAVMTGEPVQVVEARGFAATVTFEKFSVNAVFVSATAVGFVRVTVSVEMPP